MDCGNRSLSDFEYARYCEGYFYTVTARRLGLLNLPERSDEGKTSSQFEVIDFISGLPNSLSVRLQMACTIARSFIGIWQAGYSRRQVIHHLPFPVAPFDHRQIPH